MFNLFTNTAWRHTLFLRQDRIDPGGFVQGVSTQQLADELKCDYGTLLNYRHEMQPQPC